MSADPAPATARLFFALWPPAGLAAQLGELARRHGAGARPTRPATIHLTLAFLGDVGLGRLPALLAAAGRVRGPAFALGLDRLAYWAHNRILWAGGGTPPSLARLVGDLQRELAAAGFAVDGADRPFVPHVTLVRRLPAAPASLPSPELAAWPVTAFRLVRSQRAAAGADYATLAEFPLAD